MMFSTGFLSVLIYGALVWAGIAAVALLIMLVKEWRKGSIW